MITKNEIRVKMRDMLAGVTPEQRHARSIAACGLLTGTREFKNAQLIMIFLSMQSEVETGTLAVRAWSECKRIAVPRVQWVGKRMEPIEIKSLDVGMKNSGPGGAVREPIEGTQVPLGLIDLVVIPGLAFDRRGYRVGRGRGFFDRFLAQQDFQGVRCALCFHEQLLNEPVPVEEHDVPMDLIVTDREVLHCARANTPNRTVS